MLEEIADSKAPLPDVEETRRRLGSGQELIGRLTVGEWLDLWLESKRIRKSGVTRYETDIRVHLKPHLGSRRLDRLRVSHLAEMFTSIAEANAEILEQNAQRRAAVDELAKVPWKGAENRARRKAMRAAIDAMPPFRRITGAATRQRIRGDAPRSTQRRDRPADHHLQPRRARRDGSRAQAEGPRVDRRASGQVGSHRREALPRDGLDAGTDGRLPRSCGGGPSLRHVAPHRLPRAAARRGMRADVVGDRPRRVTP